MDYASTFYVSYTYVFLKNWSVTGKGQVTPIFSLQRINGCSQAKYHYQHKKLPKPKCVLELDS